MNWFTRQVYEYRAQKLLRQRDQLVGNIIAEQTRREAEIEALPNLSPMEREEQHLSFRRDFYDTPGTGVQDRYGEANARYMDTIQELGYERMNPRGKGIGAFFGRLFNGRFTRGAREQASTQLEQFMNMPSYTDEDERRLNQIPRLRASARGVLTAVKNDRECSDFTREYMYETTRVLYQQQGRPVPESLEDFVQRSRTEIKNERQLLGFMKPHPDNLNYNLNVMRVLTDLDENGKFRDQQAAVQLINNRIAELNQAVDIHHLDLTNQEDCFAKYPALERSYQCFHPISDLTKAGGCLTDESFQQVFPTPQAQADYKRTANFAMNAATQIRVDLLKECDDSTNLLRRETGRRANVAETCVAYEDRLKGEMGLLGTTNYATYNVEAERVNYPPLDRRFAQSTRERTTVNDLTREAAPTRQQQERQTEPTRQAETQHRTPAPMSRG